MMDSLTLISATASGLIAAAASSPARCKKPDDCAKAMECLQMKTITQLVYLNFMVEIGIGKTAEIVVMVVFACLLEVSLFMCVVLYWVW
jgi:hypothetical protein